MEKRVAIVAIIVEDKEKAKYVQEILHEFSELIISRMGVPNVDENINIISLVVKGNQSAISTLSGQIGNLEGVTSKVVYSKKRLNDW